MILPDIDASASILAQVDAGPRQLRLRQVAAERAPVLVDEVGTVFQPWEVELLRWPPEVETALQRSGYLPVQPLDMALWCNCAD